MAPHTSNLAFWMILLSLFWIGFFILPQMLLRRAIAEVVNIFRQSHSLCTETPKTAEELGLAPQRPMDRLFKRRDYKPFALQWLIKSGFVRLTGEGKMCLWENKLPGFQQEDRPA